ncbi:MAG: HAMP domain-containing sensor histidine kinase [Sphingobium sp.]|nr:HAMP domain-containing sensor histidine kinase [Sphingobium sp.]
MTDASSSIMRARVAADGTLLDADAPIAALQAEAGGPPDGPLAVPQLAAIARLAARLGIMVSRPVVAAAGARDIDMWVQARPEDDGEVHLSIIDWRERPAFAAVGHAADRPADFTAAGAGWNWQVDTSLCFQTVTDGDSEEDALPQPPPAIGSRLTRYVRLEPDAEGDLTILEAFSRRAAFDGQAATLIHDPATRLMLSGFPLFDMAGRLSGYRGKAATIPQDPPKNAASGEDVPAAAYPLTFGRRLDRSLRQPLGRIIANADTISAQLEGPLRPDYAGYASDIAAAGRHLLALVDDLADLQAIDRPDFTVETEEVDLADIARRAAGLLGVKALDRRIAIDTPGADESLPATGEFRRVLQILVNLIGNAVRYSPEGSRIEVRVDRHGDRARVIVTDQGPGIAAEDQARIFDKFERLGREESGGSGLGLYISRRLAQAMGGDIDVESAPGQGARFVLTLPAA